MDIKTNDNLSERINVQISTDKKTAHIDLKMSILGYDNEEILAFLAEKGVKTGINEMKIRELLLLSESEIIQRKIRIASFIPPTIGANGVVKFLIKSDINLKENKLGKVDYHDVDIIKTVKKNQSLAKIIRPQMGKSGKNVCGEIIPGIEGNEINTDFYLGENVSVNQEKTYIVADIDGWYKRVGREISVTKVIEIRGNIDYSVGNFSTSSAVLVSGDILSGFSIKTKSDMDIEGILEDANIEVGASLIVRTGIGRGECLIRVMRDIYCGYIQGRKNIEAVNILVDNFIFNSNIQAQNTIKSKKISGGIIAARKEIIVDELGNNQNSKTIIKLGLTEDDLFQIENLEHDLNLYRKMIYREADRIKSKNYKLKKDAKRIEYLLQKRRKEKDRQNSSRLYKKQQKILEQKKRLSYTLNSLKNDFRDKLALLKSLKKELDHSSAQLIVNGKLHSNVDIYLNGTQAYCINDSMESVRFNVDSKGILKHFDI